MTNKKQKYNMTAACIICMYVQSQVQLQEMCVYILIRYVSTGRHSDYHYAGYCVERSVSTGGYVYIQWNCSRYVISNTE